MSDKEKMAEFKEALENFAIYTERANSSEDSLSRSSDDCAACESKGKLIEMYQQALSQTSKPKPHTPWRK